MKILVLNYTFDASEKQITFTDYNPIILERVLLITNVTDGIIIYNFADPAKGGTASTNILTLAYDTTSMADSDKLQIFYDDNATTQPISGTVTIDTSALATSAKQDATITAIENIDLDTTTLAKESKQLPDGHNVTALDPLPTSGNNPSLVLGYTDGNLTSIQKTIGTTTYQKTLSYTDGSLTGVSEWVEV